MSKTTVGYKFAGGASATGDSWLATAAGATGDTLVTYNVNTLEETGKQMMASPIVFGPVATGDAVLLQTSDGKLHRIDQTTKILWSLDLPPGAIAASPLQTDGFLYVVGEAGWILKVDPSSGTIAGQIDVAQPIAGNPLMAGSQMLVPGAEGTLFVVDRP